MFDKRAYHKAYDKARRAGRQRNGYSKTKYQTRKELLDEIKAELGCRRCGERNPVVLLFHHLDPTKKAFPLSQAAAWGLDRVEAEIAKCEVLCANCHLIIEDERRKAAKTVSVVVAQVEQSGQPETIS